MRDSTFCRSTGTPIGLEHTTAYSSLCSSRGSTPLATVGEGVAGHAAWVLRIFHGGGGRHFPAAEDTLVQKRSVVCGSVHLAQMDEAPHAPPYGAERILCRCLQSHNGPVCFLLVRLGGCHVGVLERAEVLAPPVHRSVYRREHGFGAHPVRQQRSTVLARSHNGIG
eukprot:7378987-Prymnesium_polylepis.1